MEPQQHLIAHNKLSYVRGQRPNVPCILCAVCDDHPEVESLEVFRNAFFLVSINLYPYNSGHLMLVPLRHIEWPDELSEAEALSLHQLQKLCLAVLRRVYPACGFNIGYNLGECGGGSIAHLHLHIVPRFRNETGFMTTLAQTQIIVETPQEMQQRLKAAFAEAWL